MDDSPKVKLILVGLHSLPHGGIQSYLGQLVSPVACKRLQIWRARYKNKTRCILSSGLLRMVQRMQNTSSAIQADRCRIIYCFSLSHGNFCANGLAMVFGEMTGRKPVWNSGSMIAMLSVWRGSLSIGRSRICGMKKRAIFTFRKQSTS